MPSRTQPSCEEHPPTEATATSTYAGPPCGNQPVIPMVLTAHTPAVYPPPAHHLEAGTSVSFAPLVVVHSTHDLTCGATQNVFPVPALVPSQQQTISHVLLPVFSTQWQCRWVMQPETTRITQSAKAPQQSGLCHPSQASCCQHRSQLGSLHPLADLTQTSKSQDEAQRELTHTSRKENNRLVPEQPSDASNNNNNNKNQPTPQPRPNFSDILNKAMVNTSSKLMALLEEELNRMDGEDDENDEYSDVEERDMSITCEDSSKLTAIADYKRT